MQQASIERTAAVVRIGSVRAESAGPRLGPMEETGGREKLGVPRWST